ncbi:diaminopropionate ammonia-lyase [Pseudohalocynthiibacter sp. F2068]|jgi:diaminopropionate ammonia-lyase|uniref:diaminopropionate ammonia-lyase n=1 Tax=Pseudohalocynthiibacter sp. F2068 TaxID=2926418 RepID=UPI001FF6933F|nr:diaminopropionate ammonia-lyase [Pseudohalocynthiibacter sp. F2068]MCK0104241.1 diaminopropionate ammonia-lyase [Pseudohalocynthiibacter sp. F2068]
MTREFVRRETAVECPFTLVLNSGASSEADWTEVQDAILNDNAFDAARQTISTWPGYTETPLHELPALAQAAGVASISYKDESERFGLGSFKALGGAYAVARQLQREVSTRLGQDVVMADIVGRKHDDVTSEITVCCATDGNHGRSVAWGAQTFGCNCVIFIHATVSDGRKTAIEHFGAEVRRCAGNYDDSVREAQETASREGWFVVSDTSYPGYMEVPKDVMQGYELMASEAFDQVAQPPTHIFLQTGVGGMAAAVTAQAKRRWGGSRPKIVLADPDESACWVDSYRAGEPTAVTGDLDTLMAGLACGEVSALAWQILSTHGDAAISVPDDAAVKMMRSLARPEGGDPAVVAGESAVAGLAALFAVSVDDDACSELRIDTQSRIMVFGTEGDTDADLYRELIGADAQTVRKGQA